MRSVARGITVALALALAACGGTASTGTGTSNSYQGKTIQLGAILSLTGAGGVYGPSSRKGMDLAVERINNAGGVNVEDLTDDLGGAGQVLAVLEPGCQRQVREADGQLDGAGNLNPS